MSTVIIDHGSANTFSVLNAINHLGATGEVSSCPDDVINADKLILPGVGAFGTAMRALQKSGLVNPIIDAVTERKVPILGICLGMQLLALSSEENGYCKGLGLVSGHVQHINKRSPRSKTPHVGFNTLRKISSSVLLREYTDPLDYYFVHSYELIANDGIVVAVTDYDDIEIASIIEAENVYGVQFHPEKSQKSGLDIIRNFLFL